MEEREQSCDPLSLTMGARDELGTRSGCLARKLNLLVDAFEAEGRKVAFTDIQEAVAEDGIALDRSLWDWMASGPGRCTADDRLLAGVAKFFGVDPRYLTRDDVDLDERVEAQMELLRVMREQRVLSFTARSWGPLDAKTLRMVARMISSPENGSPPKLD